ncbi:MAG: serine/threonine-protein kinase, partial [Candidatus Obscuribacterales bacterium]
FTAAVFLLLYQPMLRLSSLLTSFCWRVISPGSLQNIIEAFLEALRLKERVLSFNEKRKFWGNALRSTAWLAICYAVLFWLFGFCEGPVGFAIQSWMIASGADAGFTGQGGADKFLFTQNYRVFLGAVIALYGTVPLAVSASVFLPYARARKINLNADGISFYQGPYLSLLGRQTRLWSDLQALDNIKSDISKPDQPTSFELKFKSGGKVKFSTAQIPAQDLRVLLDAIDEHAVNCTVDPEIFVVCQAMEDRAKEEATSDGIDDAAIKSISKQEFKSTVFVPLSPGEFIPGTKTRIIKQLASKPLCAVYMARDAQGNMQTVKQFYLADETEETRAFAKILHREYELLSKLDHPGIAKVATAFSVEKSTFLIVEHRPGSDLRAVVAEHGPRSEGLTISWAQQICEIMNYLHSREPVILHRDLAPDNIIVGDDGQLRLIDFGAAREFLEGITGTMIGKQCFVAPEQLRGEAIVQSDIFSFGCTLYFLLTGKEPRALSQSSPAKDIDCSDELDQLIRDCTNFDASERPASFDEVLQRLKKLDKGFHLKLSTPAAKIKVPA